MYPFWMNDSANFVLSKVDPFNQPAVEEIKKETKKILGQNLPKIILETP